MEFTSFLKESETELTESCVCLVPSKETWEMREELIRKVVPL